MVGAAGVVLVSLIFAPVAHGHMLVEGASDMGNGLLHPFFTPAHGLLLVGLALLLGQQLPFSMKQAVWVFAPESTRVPGSFLVRVPLPVMALA